MNAERPQLPDNFMENLRRIDRHTRAQGLIDFYNAGWDISQALIEADQAKLNLGDVLRHLKETGEPVAQNDGSLEYQVAPDYLIKLIGDRAKGEERMEPWEDIDFTVNS